MNSIFDMPDAEFALRKIDSELSKARALQSKLDLQIENLTVARTIYETNLASRSTNGHTKATGRFSALETGTHLQPAIAGHAQNRLAG